MSDQPRPQNEIEQVFGSELARHVRRTLGGGVDCTRHAPPEIRRHIAFIAIGREYRLSKRLIRALPPSATSPVDARVVRLYQPKK